MVGHSRPQRASSSGGRSFMSSAQACEAMMRAPSTNWLPKVWSPLAWVLINAPICELAGTAERMALSMSAVIFRSNSVSTNMVWPESSIKPALDQPQLPSGTK